jgi:hypothetical protein
LNIIFGFDINITPKKPKIAEIISYFLKSSPNKIHAKKTVAIGHIIVRGTDSDNGSIGTPKYQKY